MNSKYVFLIFFSIVFVIYALVNYYIYWHIKQWRPSSAQLGWFLSGLFWLVVASYPLGRVLERFYPSVLTDWLVKLGSVWLGAMLYFTLFFIAIDLLRLIGYSATQIFKTANFSSVLLGGKSLLFVSISVFSLLVYGYVNALHPRVSRVEVKTSKYLNPQGRLVLAVASDIHLGTVISNGRLSRLVSLINNYNPDAVLLAGDIFDEDIGPVIKRNMGNLIAEIQSKHGVFAVTGNHEYIGGANPAVDYLTRHGVQVLRDSSVLVNNSFWIIGREDRQAKYMANYTRKGIAQLIERVDSSKFLVLLDHQPYNLFEAYENSIDLQLSGHTHHGQLWPFNYITGAIFEVSSGYRFINGTHFYVSPGFGTWGPPMRIGNRPEIAIIEITSVVNN